MHTASYFIAVVLGLALTLGAVPARAETVNCTPMTSFPGFIVDPGIYCLTQDIHTNIAIGNAAITIAASNVVIDLNGHVLGNLSAGSGTLAQGIYAAQQKNITIKNGTIRGFEFAIFLDDSAPFTTSQGHVIEDLRADQNTVVGIQVRGRGNLIRNNQIEATGGTTALGADVDAYGIVASGPENKVLNNDVINTFATGGGISYGIKFSSAPDSLAVNNRITEAQHGIDFFTSTGTTGKYRDNLTSGVTTPFASGSGITDAGNNN